MNDFWSNLSEYWKDIFIVHVKLDYFEKCDGWFGDMKDGDINIFEEYRETFGKVFLRDETYEDIKKIFELRHLSIQMLGLKDIEPVRKLNLFSIQAYANDISDISPLSENENIEIIDISMNNISDISSLENNLKIRAIDLSGNPLQKEQLKVLPENSLIHSFNLGKQEKDDFWELKKEISKRRIDYLVHFTPTINLYSILENKGLFSREKLENLDVEQFDVLDYIKFTDDVRYDDKSYINLSLSGPNTFLLAKFTQKTENDPTISWCILLIKPELICWKNTLFSVTNAASNAAKSQFGIAGGIQKFKQLFEPELNIKTFSGARKLARGSIADKYPTDVQAEILVKDSIPLDSIISVCFQSKEKLAEAKAAMYEFNSDNFIVNSEIFNPNRNK